MIKQRSPEWYAARRLGVTSTDMVAILGLSPYASEGDIARGKQSGDEMPSDKAGERRMRLGRSMEDLIRAEEEIEHGVKLRRVGSLLRHREHPWALTSLDFERIGERTIVETKASSRRIDDLPEDWEVQVRWQMGVARYPAAHVAALRFGRELVCFDLDHDQATFDRMVVIGADFMKRLAAGGPFEENRASVRRAFPLDDGTAIVADGPLAEQVRDLIHARVQKSEWEDRADKLEAAVQNRMGPASLLTGQGFRITWRRAKDSTTVKWEEMAQQLMEDYPDRVRAAIVEKHTQVRAGSRRFIIKEDGK